MRRLPVLGIDIGGVIVSSGLTGEDTSFFGDRPMLTPPVPGAIQAIAVLASSGFDGRVHLVSKAGPKIAAISREWLQQSGFFAATGLDLDHVHFVRDRADKDAACAALGVTHFVDDRISVLRQMPSVPNLYLFTGGMRDERKPGKGDIPPGIVAVGDWATLHRLLTESTKQR